MVQVKFKPLYVVFCLRLPQYRHKTLDFCCGKRFPACQTWFWMTSTRWNPRQSCLNHGFSVPVSIPPRLVLEAQPNKAQNRCIPLILLCIC